MSTFTTPSTGIGVTFSLSIGAFMDPAKTSIAAVHDDDLKKFLESLGVLGDVTNGKAKCKFCRDVLTLESLAAVFPESGDVKFVCDKPGCLSSLTEHRSELRGKEREIPMSKGDSNG